MKIHLSLFFALLPALTFPVTAQENEPPLSTAITKGDLAAVKAAIEAKPDILKKQSRGYTPLMRAIQSGKTEIVAFLLEKGADPNQESYNNTPLAAAFNYGSQGVAIADLLLKKGAKIESLDSEGYTPLLRAVYSGSKDRVEYLLGKGADIKATDRRGRGILDIAFVNSNPEILKLLLEKADIKTRDGEGRTPLHSAVLRNLREPVAQLIAKGADINTQDLSGETPLHLAARTPSSLIKTLLDVGAKTDIENNRGDLPLHIALRRPDEWENVGPRYYSGYDDPRPRVSSDEATPRGTFVAPLTEKSDVNSKDQFGISPLLMAIKARDQESRDLLAERKPRADSTTQLFDAVSQGDTPNAKAILAQKPFLAFFRLADGMTPLHISALWGTLGAAQELVAKGADVNARDSHGDAPLHDAVSRPEGLFARRSRNMAAFLLEKGADINALDANDSSPLHRVVKSGDEELLTLLLVKGAKINLRDKAGQTPLFSLITNSKTGGTKTLETLLEKGADVNIRDKTGQTPLTRAVSVRRADIAKLLIAKGADINARDNEGRTVLAQLDGNFYGSDTNTRELLALLLEKGADPNEKYHGESLLSRALGYSSDGSKETIKLLLATKKVDLNDGGSQQTPPLIKAISHGRDKELVSMLLEAGADPNVKDSSGKSALKVAESRKAQEIIDLLKAKGAKDE